MLSSPLLILSDEPTTGLDSSQAHKVVKKLKEVAVSNRIPSVVTLHAPRGSVYNVLTDVLLLAPGGEPVYIGPAKEACAYFNKLGFKCRKDGNVAEFLIDLVSVDVEEEEIMKKDLERIDILTEVSLPYCCDEHFVTSTSLLTTPPPPHV